MAAAVAAKDGLLEKQLTRGASGLGLEISEAGYVTALQSDGARQVSNSACSWGMSFGGERGGGAEGRGRRAAVGLGRADGTQRRTVGGAEHQKCFG